MTVKELRDFIDKIPAEMDELMVVNGEVGYLDPNDTDSMVYRVDNPIIALYVDEQTNELCLFHQTREDVNNIFPNKESNGNS